VQTHLASTVRAMGMSVGLDFAVAQTDR